MATKYTPVPQPTQTNPPENGKSDYFTFPYPADKYRLQQYDYYENLFLGNHFDAFLQKIDSPLYGKEYSRLRYVAANFAGLVTKVCADLLFIEPPKIKVADGDQQFVDDLVTENKLPVVMYESAIANSYQGDNLFKVRLGKRHPSDEDMSLIIEEQTAKVYFPKLNPNNVKEQPLEQELAWKVKIGEDMYLRKEIHVPGYIYNKLYLLKDETIVMEVDLSLLGIPDLLPEQETKVDRPLLVHVPNFRAGNRYFGLSDYYDLGPLFYAINNRITKVDNILDKHSDPILALPPGILDENGRVKKERLGLIERPEGATGDQDPAYITWDANLESAFLEIDKLMEMLFMTSEVSPAAFGMDKDGVAESGRALKFKLLRTLAKVQRKQLYYGEALKEVIFTAQKLAKAWGIKVNGRTLQGEPKIPEIEWRDGLPADMMEMVDIEVKRLDAGLTTAEESIMRLDDVDEDTAKEKAGLIKKETESDLRMTTLATTPPAPKGGIAQGKR